MGALVVVIILVFLAFVVLVGTKEERDSEREKTKSEMYSDRQQITEELNNKGFTPSFLCKNTAGIYGENMEVFSFSADISNKKIFISSYLDKKHTMFDFSEIAAFSLIEGERNTTIYSSGVVGAGLVGVGNFVKSKRTRVGLIKLKIDTYDMYNLTHIFTINTQQIDVNSDKYNELINMIERLKSFLTKVIEDSKIQ